jgi:uncharacterized protein involved in exopolysaccharide biosynthesis
LIALAVEIVAKYFVRIVLFSLLCASLAAWALLSRPDIYESRTLLLYRLGREYVFVPDPIDSGARLPNPGDLQFVVNAEMQILNNSELIAHVVDEIGPETLYPQFADAEDPWGQAAAALSSAVSINAVPGAYVLQVRARHTVPEMAAAIADALVRVYLEKRVEIFRGHETRLLRDQLTAASAQASQMSHKIADFLADKAVVSYQDELSSLTSQQARLREQYSQAQATRAGLLARQESLLAEMKTIAETVTDREEFQRNPTVVALEGQLLALAAERRSAVRTVGENHPTVANLDAEAEALRAEIATQPEQVFVGSTQSANPAYRQLEGELMQVRVELKEHEAQTKEIEEQIRQGDARLREFAEVTDQVSLMEQQLDRQQAQVTSLDARVREAEVFDSLDREGQTSVRIIEPATVPFAPVGFPKTLRLMIALVFGGIVGAGAGVLSYLARPTLLSGVIAAQRLRLPVLAEIPSVARAAAFTGAARA